MAADEAAVEAADEPEADWPTHEVDEPSVTVTCARERRVSTVFSRGRETRRARTTYLSRVDGGAGAVGEAEGDLQAVRRTGSASRLEHKGRGEEDGPRCRRRR